jgi:hypothetical protein
VVEGGRWKIEERMKKNTEGRRQKGGEELRLL